MRRGLPSKLDDRSCGLLWSMDRFTLFAPIEIRRRAQVKAGSSAASAKRFGWIFHGPFSDQHGYPMPGQHLCFQRGKQLKNKACENRVVGLLDSEWLRQLKYTAN